MPGLMEEPGRGVEARGEVRGAVIRGAVGRIVDLDDADGLRVLGRRTLGRGELCRMVGRLRIVRLGVRERTFGALRTDRLGARKRTDGRLRTDRLGVRERLLRDGDLDTDRLGARRDAPADDRELRFRCDSPNSSVVNTRGNAAQTAINTRAQFLVLFRAAMTISFSRAG